MKNPVTDSPIFRRYNLTKEQSRLQGVRQVSENRKLQRIALSRVAGNEVETRKDVVEACRIHLPIMVIGTALMTTTMTAFPRVATRLKEAGLEIPFVCGAGSVITISP